MLNKLVHEFNIPENLSHLVPANACFKSNHCLLVYGAVKTTINDKVGWCGYMGKVVRV